jgi:Abnormal spindle-like microcephaly-assoc'd, ASPM-SPD-2-Hydin
MIISGILHNSTGYFNLKVRYIQWCREILQTTLVGGINDPLGVALDAAGNIYVSSAAAGTILKLDTADPPSLSFGTTIAGTTSTAQSVTVTNYGNAPLTFPLPATGSNPDISANFALNATGSAACPQLSATSTAPGTLAPNSSCQLPVTFAPAAGGNITGSLILTDNNLNTSSPNYATQTIALSGTALQVPTDLRS